MKTEIPALGFLLLSVVVSAAVALAQNAAKPASEDVYVLGEFRVNTAKDDSFIATESTSGTRVATEIINLPFAVSVLTEDFVKVFQLFDLDQQAPFISGMAAGDPAQGGGGGTQLDLSLNVANVLDRKALTVAAYYPEGRTVRVTAGVRF